ncbi:hypothetical protein ROJ8625_00370 [Roseivivax jejudonensis]|uniref:IrrE N-terminal-like domain-containing protein n=1 Tax=Roseivivax jejudonensis TaxID=1529041 RepID=A0A1X6Y7I4_9RHOB|nr:ImmA/IrrE family metallo-endopeptidase [Roseivivax jejudonensis]SLN12847.1 hypothetical protein ROJ8625_00370 [Roseivivax jejudonensis]
MELSRIELCDLRTPEAIARGIRAQLDDDTPRIPVRKVACALGVQKINISAFDGFEGMLLTDPRRSRGIIAANNRHGARRARFTIAHELGHFLMEWHVLSGDLGFQCRTEDMRESREDRRDRQQETQANLFAIELLAPNRMVPALLSREPDLRDAQRIRDAFDISLEAAVRRMIVGRDEPLAAVLSKGGRIRYAVRSNGFPYIRLNPRDVLPDLSVARRAVEGARTGFTPCTETHSGAWTDRQDMPMWEQTRVGKNATAVTLLEAELPSKNDDCL